MNALGFLIEMVNNPLIGTEGSIQRRTSDSKKLNDDDTHRC